MKCISTLKGLCAKERLFFIIIFLIISILCHWMFLGDSGYIFIIPGTDGTSQMLPFKSFLEQNWSDGNFFWSYDYGLGGDIFGEFAYYYSTSPFFIVQLIIKKIFDISLFDYNIALQWKVLLSIFKQFLAMAVMYELLRYESNNKNKWYNAIGAVVYGTGVWFVRYSLAFDYMTDAIVWLPLVCLGVQKFKREKKSALFIITFSLMLMNSFYFGYMSCLFIGSYIMLCEYEKGIAFKMYLKKLISYLFRIFIAFGISAVSFFPAVYSFFSSGRESGDFVLDLFPETSDFFSFFENVFMAIKFDNDAILTSLPICLAMIVFIPWRKTTFEVRKKSLLAIIWFVLFFIPAFSAMMNGFSYETDRWCYIILFAIAWATPAWLSKIEERINLLKAIILVDILLGYFLVKFIYNEEAVLSNFEYLAFGLGIISIFVLVVISKGKVVYQEPRYNQSVIWLFILVAMTAICHNAAFANVQGLQLNRDADMNQIVSHSLSANLPDNNVEEMGFYRISDRNIENSKSRRENTYLLAGESGLSAYNSLIKGNLQDYLKNDHNVYMRYMTPSYYNGLDSRLFLENAWGVKYILGDENIPYGYHKIEAGSGNIYENEYCVGIDLWYESVMPLSDYNNLNIASKDAAVLQAAVVSNTERKYETEELDDTVVNLPLDFSQLYMENCSFENDKLYVEKDGDSNVETTDRGMVKIDLPEIEQEGEFLISLNIRADERYVDLEYPYLFKLSVNGKDVYKYRNEYQWTYDLDQFTFKVGQDEEQITLQLTPGVYKILSAELYFSSYEKISDWTKERNKYNMENLDINKNKITGTINNDDSGILALNVPYNKGWNCYVNGEKQSIIQVDNVFIGIELNEGPHDIELVFWPPFFRIGFTISGITVILCTIIYFVRKKWVKGRML